MTATSSTPSSKSPRTDSLHRLSPALALAGSACDGPLELFPGPCTSEHGRWDEEWDYWSYRYDYGA